MQQSGPEGRFEKARRKLPEPLLAVTQGQFGIVKMMLLVDQDFLETLRAFCRTVCGEMQKEPVRLLPLSRFLEKDANRHPCAGVAAGHSENVLPVILKEFQESAQITLRKQGPHVSVEGLGVMGQVLGETAVQAGEQGHHSGQVPEIVLQNTVQQTTFARAEKLEIQAGNECPVDVSLAVKPYHVAFERPQIAGGETAAEESSGGSEQIQDGQGRRKSLHPVECGPGLKERQVIALPVKADQKGSRNKELRNLFQQNSLFGGTSHQELAAEQLRVSGMEPGDSHEEGESARAPCQSSGLGIQEGYGAEAIGGLCETCDLKEPWVDGISFR